MSDVSAEIECAATKVELLDWRGYDEITDIGRQSSAFEIHWS